MSTPLNVMSWSLQAGGYEAYNVPVGNPPQEQAITTLIDGAKRDYDVDSVVLPNAYNWHKTYEGDAGIATHLGFAAAHFTPLADTQPRFKERDGEGIGTVIATDHPVEQWMDVDMGTRQAAGAILDVGGYSVQLVGIYLDDLSEDVRVKQVEALLHNIEQDVPTIFTGRFNMLRPDLKGAAFADKLFDRLVLRAGIPLLAKVLSKREDVKTLYELNQRRAYEVMIDSKENMDVDYRQSRTTETRTGHMSVDYAFVRGVGVTGFDVLDHGGASDHHALVLQTTGGLPVNQML